MIEIYIDTSDRKERLVRLKNDSEILEEISGDIDLVLEISRILRKNNLGLSDISKFSYNKGPGSFTGLKIGSAISNIINWAVLGKDMQYLEYPRYGAEPNIQLAPELESN